MTWQEKDSWLSILGPIHMTGVPQKEAGCRPAGWARLHSQSRTADYNTTQRCYDVPEVSGD